MLFRYVWIIILILIWMIWTGNVILSIVDDFKYCDKKLSFVEIIEIIFDNNDLGTFIFVHLILLFFISFMYWFIVG